jgi:hypothetical protein
MKGKEANSLQKMWRNLINKRQFFDLYLLAAPVNFIVLLFYCFIVLLFYCFIVLLVYDIDKFNRMLVISIKFIKLYNRG